MIVLLSRLDPLARQEGEPHYRRAGFNSERLERKNGWIAFTHDQAFMGIRRDGGSLNDCYQRSSDPEVDEVL